MVGIFQFLHPAARCIDVHRRVRGAAPVLPPAHRTGLLASVRVYLNSLAPPEGRNVNDRLAAEPPAPVMAGVRADSAPLQRCGGGVPRRRSRRPRALSSRCCRLASCMPAGGHVLNICGDRYRFTVGFAASAAPQEDEPAALDAHAADHPAARTIRARRLLPDR